MRVVIVGDTGIKDAVISAPFTADAVVLFVGLDTIPQVVSDELTRLAPDEILVFGGTARVSDAVIYDLGLFAPVTRIAGPTVFDTAVAASQVLYPVAPPVDPPIEPPPTGLFIPKLNGPILGAFTDAEKAAMPLYTGKTTIRDTRTIEGVKIDARITVRDSGHLTLKNCWIVGDKYYSVWNDTRWGPSMLEVYDSEVGAPSRLSERGVAGRAIVKRCYIHHVEDGVKFGSDSIYEQLTIEYLDAPRAGPHADCFQASGHVVNSDIGYCYLSAFTSDGVNANAAIIIKSDSGTQDDIRIHDSFLAGGNYTVYVREGGQGPPTNISFTNNILDNRPLGLFEGKKYGLLSNDSPDLEWVGNTDLITGNPV